MSESTDNLPQPNLEAGAQPSLGDWHRQSEEAWALISRLTERVRKRDRRIALLETALARTALMHHVWTSHLERKLERSSASGTSAQPNLQGLSGGTRSAAPAADDSTGGVVVHLPHLTRTLEALFDVMREQWSDWDFDHPPKSSTVARAIDEKLGLKPQSNGEASRSAQTFAAALRPDSVNELDGRHR
ncbi:MAG: hypothetical protein EPN73_22460 [Paraburkholderia sp.]|uniref:Uncharacterized protein n=1 Tax=Paraburkholderia terricola TaxID=169427 RepID=A0A1M6J207_9BURK|nr:MULTISPECIES: hypothetical protein [Paraburkholderia]TAL93142.1 MAG: hypothetical protein EPN73_22460 [Paraburkholderia sp.]SDN48708.1 hypothetical protein SAMN05192547_100114 [Paraburkholderia sediminicola]SHJ40725.1 hypothetical protein SAMN05192548_1001341 [Paraburkholderia terricola]